KAGWFSAGPALVLAWIYVLAQGSRFDDYRQVGLTIIPTLLIWWLGESPALASHGVRPSSFDPLLTAALGLAIVLFGRRGEVGFDISPRRVDLADRTAFLLSLIACAFTLGDPTYPTITTLLLATATLGILAVVRHRVASAYAGAFTWCAFCAL